MDEDHMARVLSWRDMSVVDRSKVKEPVPKRNLWKWTWRCWWSESEDDRNDGERYTLKGCFGLVRSGEILYVMGPSGTGKTLLLSVLSDQLRKQTCFQSEATRGSVVADGVVMNRWRFPEMAKMVPQRDILYATLTVEETLTVAAKLYSSQDTVERGGERARRKEREGRNVWSECWIYWA
mmetsp:Transcript_9156/g.18570  ORF Transcript_9156/g.18570 Transcript_9156/m.18570 type:complete len:180 (+) Transcript_9156:460-999(+)